MIWSNFAIDYSAGLTIYDALIGIKYSNEQARQLPKEIQQRLVMKPNKIGCYVLTAEEAEEIMEKKRHG